MACRRRAGWVARAMGRPPMEKLPREGRRRLIVLLSLLSGGTCVFAMAAVLMFHGTPYDTLWWWVMGAILAAAFAAGHILVIPVEWVIAGCRSED